MMITIRNNFHGTQVSLRAGDGDELTPSQIRRAWRALCGHNDCCCGGCVGQRGPQDVIIEEVAPGRVRISAIG